MQVIQINIIIIICFHYSQQQTTTVDKVIPSVFPAKAGDTNQKVKEILIVKLTSFWFCGSFSPKKFKFLAKEIILFCGVYP